VALPLRFEIEKHEDTVLELPTSLMSTIGMFYCFFEVNRKTMMPDGRRHTHSTALDAATTAGCANSLIQLTLCHLLLISPNLALIQNIHHRLTAQIKYLLLKKFVSDLRYPFGFWILLTVK